MTDDTSNTPETTNEDTGSTGNAEAARYRRKLRETEAERDTLAARVEALQRAEVRRLAEGAKLHNPDDFTVDLDDVLDDDGSIDADRVGERLEALKADRPYLFEKPSRPDFGGGDRGSDIGSGDKPMTWAEALKPPALG